VDTWIKQLQTHDATQGHTADVGVLSGYAKEASGISENMLGQFSPGRRSAREAVESVSLIKCTVAKRCKRFNLCIG